MPALYKEKTDEELFEIFLMSGYDEANIPQAIEDYKAQKIFVSKLIAYMRDTLEVPADREPFILGETLGIILSDYCANMKPAVAMAVKNSVMQLIQIHSHFVDQHS